MSLAVLAGLPPSPLGLAVAFGVGLVLSLLALEEGERRRGSGG